MLLVACNPGADQPPVPATVSIYNPLHNNSDLASSNNAISTRYVFTIVTTDKDYNIVAYPNGGSIVQNTPVEPRVNRDFPYLHDLVQPEGATAFTASIRVTAKECRWPIPGEAFSAQKVVKLNLRLWDLWKNILQTFRFIANDFQAVWGL
ncbi:MAG: hypothetical protein U5L96_00210 [Owenweeksia sp.]|nr:hypothetical protein [Owenweeksia sp.]